LFRPSFSPSPFQAKPELQLQSLTKRHDLAALATWGHDGIDDDDDDDNSLLLLWMILFLRCVRDPKQRKGER
jgi:hypothetical protein